MATASKQSAKRARAVPAAEAERPVAPDYRTEGDDAPRSRIAPQDMKTTSDMNGFLIDTLQDVADDAMPLKKANTIVGVTGKILKSVELEVKTGERNGGRRKALPLQVA